jgi:FKBP-type peptidyl-prolyl cis-trans isomerase
VNKAYGKFDANRAAQNGYQCFPFEAGKDRMIPGFIEGLDNMGLVIKQSFYSANLAYGEKRCRWCNSINTMLLNWKC